MAAKDALSGDQFGAMAGYAKNLTKAGLNPSKAAPKSRAGGMAGAYNNLRTNIHRGLATSALNADPTGGNMPSSGGGADLGGYFGHPAMANPAVKTNSKKPSNSTGGKRKPGKIAGLKAHASKYAGNLAANLKRQTGAA